MKFEKKQIHKQDLLKLPAEGVIEIIAKNLSGEIEKNSLTVGEMVIKRIGSIALEPKKNNIVISGESSLKQGFLMTFGVHDKPTIKPSITLLGTYLDKDSK